MDSKEKKRFLENYKHKEVYKKETEEIIQMEGRLSVNTNRMIKGIYKRNR